MSESNRSPSRGSNPDSVARMESNVSELDPELEELYRVQNRNAARVAALQLLIPALLVTVLVATGAWTYIRFANTRNEIREKIKDDPDRAMEMLIRAAGEHEALQRKFPKGIEFDPTTFNSGPIRFPGGQDQRDRK